MQFASCEFFIKSRNLLCVSFDASLSPYAILDMQPETLFPERFSSVSGRQKSAGLCPLQRDAGKPVSIKEVTFMKKTPRRARILALIGIILLLGMYGSTMVFALMKSPAARGLLMGAVFCTIAVPVLLYAILLAAKNVRGKALPHHDEEKADASAPESGQEDTPAPGRENSGAPETRREE